MTSLMFLAQQIDAAFHERLKKIMEGNDLEEKRTRLRMLQKRRLENLLGRGRAKEIKKTGET